jgi:putative component of membrane protein insertase Oxa1/YidC/SpoIIIJ protein YidD
MLRWLAIGMIRVYQRWISPYKGFRCAHRVVHGGASCSEFAVQAIQSHGAFGFWPDFRTRLTACNAAAISYREMYFSAPTEGDVGSEPPEKGRRRTKSKASDCAGDCAVSACLFMPTPDGGGEYAPVEASVDASGCDGGGCDVGGCSP